jgi:hypothetical protein
VRQFHFLGPSNDCPRAVCSYILLTSQELVYSWTESPVATEPTVVPTAQPSISDEDAGVEHILSIKAVAAVYTTTPTMIPTSASATPLSFRPAEVSYDDLWNNREFLAVVGTALGSIAILTLVAMAWCFRVRRKRWRRLRDARSQADNREAMGKSELPAESIPRHQIARELNGASVFEMADTSSPTELDESQERRPPLPLQPPRGPGDRLESDVTERNSLLTL